MRYFYIIQRDGQIFEIPFSEENYTLAVAEMTKKGLLTIKPKGHELPVVLNSVDITKILTEDAYKNHINGVRPKEYLYDGTWRDGKERQVIRYEKWKQKEMEQRMKLSNPDDKPPTKEEGVRIEKIKTNIRKNLKGGKS